MQIFYTETFEKLFEKLPKHINKKVERRIFLFKQNPFLPILKTEKLNIPLATGLGASVDPSSLIPATYTTNIVISGNFTGSPFTIPVTFTITVEEEPTTETIATIKETVSNFLKAQQHRNFDEARPYLTTEFAATIDPIGFVGTSNPHTGRFEFKDTVQFSSLAKAYELRVRVYQEYTGEGDIGYNDDTFFVKQVGEKYLISNIKYGQYIPFLTIVAPAVGQSSTLNQMANVLESARQLLNQLSESLKTK